LKFLFLARQRVVEVQRHGYSCGLGKGSKK